MEIRIEANSDGKRLSDYLSTCLGLSRRSISALKKLDNGIILNGRRVTVAATVHTDDLLILACEDEESPENILPTELPLDIIYEDADIIALNKPPKMPTHPSHGHYTDTLANALAFYYAQKGIPFVFRVINRLDRDTSGIVLVAKNRRSAFRLSNEIGRRKIGKCYLALTDGAPVEKSGKITAYIRRAAESIIVREASDTYCDGASYSETLYQVIDEKDGIGIAGAMPVTGRTHQLRLHFAHIGHPIIGDSLYGNRSELINRQALHAFSLTFNHPTSGRQMTLIAPISADISAVIKESGADTREISEKLSAIGTVFFETKSSERNRI